MAELTPSEKLQPALLDRLRDDEPEASVETRDQRVMSMRRLRDSVIRDLGWLLNTQNLHAVLPEVAHYAQARHSVINYGLPDLAGRVLTREHIPALEGAVREAIRHFEPRLLHGSVRVHVDVNEAQLNRRALTFHIEAQLWSRPIPEQLYLKTELDLETGSVQIDGVPASQA